MKFWRALHSKWRAKVTAIEESKELSSLALDELIGNLKLHKVVMEKDSKIYRGKKERTKSIALKAKKESSDDETLTSGSNDEEYALAVRNFIKCGDPNHLIGNCPIPSRNKDQMAFLEVLGAIAKMTPKTKPTMKLVSWLNSQISPPPTKLSPLVDDDVGEQEAIKRNIKVVNNNNEEYESIEVDKIVKIKESKNHPLDQLQNLCDDFVKIMHDEFEMSMMGELNFFLGLQIKQIEDGIFFNQSKYIKEMLKKFGLEDSKPTKTPMSKEIKLTEDDESDSVDSFKYRALVVFVTFNGDIVYHLVIAKETNSLVSLHRLESESVPSPVECSQQALWMKQASLRLRHTPRQCFDYVRQ
ncbi:retrovirus-related pol polyprotein from transposon TNT 1-94 [Tanacetum coccineum]